MKSMLCLLLMLPFLTGWMPPLHWQLGEDYDYGRHEAAMLKSRLKIADFKAFLPRPRPPPPKKAKSKYGCEAEVACVATGNFNFSPDGDSLYMEAACLCVADEGARVIKKGYTVASRVKPKIFGIPFVLSVVGEETTDDGQKVYLFYRKGMTPDGEFTRRTLAERPDAEFSYSFKEYVDQDIIRVKDIPFMDVIER